MSNRAIERLRNPPHDDPALSVDEDTRLAIRLFLNNPSDKTYESNRDSILWGHPDDVLPSYYKIKHFIAYLTGIDSVVHDMCVNWCIAYTGHFSELETCPLCSEPRYELSGTRLSPVEGAFWKSRQKFHTIPVGPQIQALYRDRESASHAHYLRKERSRVLSEIEQNLCLDEYPDVVHGTDMIHAFQDGRIEEDDIVLMFSIDGAQLYARRSEDVCLLDLHLGLVESASLVVPKISEMGSCYFVHAREKQVLCEIVKQKLCVIHSPLLKEGLRYALSGGQNFDCPPARGATVSGRNPRNHSRNVA
jgi:hypothetical protein